MKLYLGIDGGGSHTTGCLADARGRVIGTAEAGIGNPNHATDAELKEQFGAILNSLLTERSIPRKNCVSVFAGMAGVTCEETAERVRRGISESGLGHAVIGVDHDIRTALAGGLSLRPGIAVIVGTGSSCYGRGADGRTWQTGGWGALIADEGSGYVLGRDAIKAAVQMADGRMQASSLVDAVFDWLGIKDVSQVLERIYGAELSRQEIAAFAPKVLDLAATGDIAANGILAAGAEELGKMVAANHSRLPTSPEPEIVITGGLGTADACYRPMIEAAITRHLPTARIQKLEMDAARGAVLLAISQSGGEVNEDIVTQLKESV